MYEIYYMKQFSHIDKIAGLLDVLLSWKIYVPLSRLTYSTYLIHVIIIQSHVASSMIPVYLSDYSMVSITTVAFGSLIRPAVQSKRCQNTQLQSLRHSHGVSMSVGKVALRPKCWRLTPIGVRTPISNTHRRCYINSAIHSVFNSLNAKLNPICHLLALGAHHILHVGKIRVK
jgi:hypothetical protein